MLYPASLSQNKFPLSTKIIPPSTISPIGSMREIAKLNHPFSVLFPKEKINYELVYKIVLH
jgi:hypothetical protein